MIKNSLIQACIDMAGIITYISALQTDKSKCDPDCFPYEDLQLFLTQSQEILTSMSNNMQVHHPSEGTKF